MKKFRTPEYSQINTRINLVQHLYISDYIPVPKTTKSLGADWDLDYRPFSRK